MIIDNKIKDNDKYIVFDSTGGQGKQVQATAVIRAIKKKYPERKIVWVCSWDSAAFYNPNVFRFFTQGQFQYFRDYLREDTIIMKHDPYNETNHILRKEHLVETWCKMFDVPYDGCKPDIYLNPRELEIARDKIKPDNRPILLLQTHGGGGGNSQYSKKSWYRDMPIEIAQKLINYFAKSYRILHIKNPDQPVLQGVEPLTLPLRELYAVFPLSTKRLFIDSFAAHVAAGLGLQSTVVWIGNSPKVFGYPENINILPSAEIINNFDKFSYLQDDISGMVQNFPYDTVNLFDINKIIEAVNKQK